MRISDWSSDVCSSDLHLPQRGIGIGVGRSRNGHGRGEFGITKRREGTREARDDERYQHRRPGERRRRGAGHHIDARADRRTDAEEHQVDRPQRFPEAVIPRLMPNVIEALADEQAVLRSEETTSELQSLMRTSYA